MPADSPTDPAPPATVTFENHTYTPITEGQATILFPNTNEVFYNPVQQFNRDMSVAAIRTWSKHYFQEQQEREANKRQRRQATQPAELATNAELAPGFSAPTDFTILEALSATGLRSIRYAKEVPQVRSIVANDLEPDAVASIRRNLAYNGLDETLVRPNCDDACALMYRHRSDPRQGFHVVDLDPYGSASPFLDAAVQAVSSDGGLLCVTCTDLAVLAGTNYPEVCFAKYGGTPVKADYCHEMALRLLLNAIQASAVRYRRYIVPMISCSIDFYIRVFVRVYSGAAQVKKALCQTGLVYTCTGCRSYFTDPIGRATTTENRTKYGIGTGPSVDSHCQFCGHRFQLGGPAWLGPLHCQPFVDDMYQLIRESDGQFATKARMLGMVKVISEELDTPFFHTLANLGKTMHCTIPPLISV
ncbi:RNA methyltransferase tRNA(m5U54)methyltransferase, partial [Dimargaris verticillata]